MTRKLTGRHVLAITVTAFAIIIGANMAMLMAATGTFPGLVVKNSYIASQEWNGRAGAQVTLGWQARVGYADGALHVTLSDRAGRPVEGAELTARIGRPSDARSDRTLVLTPDGAGYSARLELAPGRWLIDVATLSDPKFRQQVVLLTGDLR